MSHRVLVVDDEPDITALVAYHLAKAGYRVSTASSGAEALKASSEERPDVVVLDLMLPGLSGYDVLSELRSREETRDVGVILLTARRDEPDRIKGLTLGADDYLTKPFSPAELTLRVQALLRRLGSPAVAAGSTLVADQLTIDRAAHRASIEGRELNLTATEYKLLRYLLLNAGRVLTRAQILDHVWQYDFDGDSSVVETYMSYLRRKVDGGEPKLLHTVRGVGYCLRVDP